MGGGREGLDEDVRREREKGQRGKYRTECVKDDDTVHNTKSV